ncbi:MAG: Cthe_2314 family HEPN domain-containing protein [Candidatus Omnitrophota bacterium]
MQENAELLPSVIERSQLEHTNITKTKEWRDFVNSVGKLEPIVIDNPFVPEFNAVFWAFDIDKLCREIAYGLGFMRAYASYYKSKYQEQSRFSHSDFHITYFANNCVTKIDSCKDKIALMVWSYYVPFNPEEKLFSYEDIIDRLKVPKRYGLNLKNTSSFLIYLEVLKNECFQKVEKYRHLKVHKLEPQIQIYGVRGHHDIEYMFPLFYKREIEAHRQKLKKMYPTTDNLFLKRKEESGNINGILYDRRRVEDRNWSYSEVERIINNCFLDLIRVVAKCCQIIRSRKPFRGKYKIKQR